MPDLSMSTLNLVFAGLSIGCAVMSAVMFVLARRAAERDRAALGPRRIEAPRRTRAAARPAVDPYEVDDYDDEVEVKYDEYDEYDEVDDAVVAVHDELEYDELEYEEYEDEVDESLRRAERSTAKLPKGAEAALWAITETVPDPRNHLVLKDPTSEVRLHPILTGASSPEPVPADAPDAVVDLDDPDLDGDDRHETGGGLQQGRMRGAIDETDVFTGEFFFAGEPKLNRF